MTPLVTAIVTSYNHAEYLDQRMDSLLKQAFDNMEIIVVDDCSSDESREVLERYRGNSKVDLVFLERNGGYANACNLGIKMSRGKYVMFAECDDYDDPEHIRTLVKVMEENEQAGAAYCRSSIVDERGTVLGTDYDVRENAFKRYCTNDVLIPRRTMARFFLFACVIPNMSAALIRKTAIESVGHLSPAFRACADWDLWCRMSEKYDFYYVAKPMNYFRTHPNTVRKKASVALQVGEYYDLLYRSFPHVGLSPGEALRFRMRCGLAWAHFITVNPLDWFKSFPAVCRKSFSHDRLSLLYLMTGMLAKVGRWVQRRLMR